MDLENAWDNFAKDYDKLCPKCGKKTLKVDSEKALILCSSCGYKEELKK